LKPKKEDVERVIEVLEGIGELEHAERTRRKYRDILEE